MTLFDQNDQIDENLDYLAELTKPGAKFDRTKYESEADMYKDIAKGKYVADHFISTKNRQYDDLYNEHLALREKATTGASLETVLDQIQKLQTSSNDNTLVNDVNIPVPKPEELKNTVSSLLQELKQQEKEEDNYQTVQNKLKERFGANAGTFLKQKADSLNLSENEAIAMAKRNPTLFYKTFDVEITPSNEQFQTPPHSQQRSEGFAPKSNKRTLKWYQKLKQDNPTEYYKPQTSIQMDKDSQELGQAFFD